jgi:hypothetical protein
MCSLFFHTLTNVGFLCLTFCPSKVSNSKTSLPIPLIEFYFKVGHIPPYYY